MKKLIFKAAIGFCFLGICNLAFCQKDKPEYSITNIPPALFADAHTVIREDHTVFEIKSLDLTTYKGREVKTILNKKGDYNASHYIRYDKDIAIKSFTGTVYDKYGKLVRKLKNAEINDYSAISSFSIYEDSRMKTAELLYSDYPFTVEFEYEIEYKSSYVFPSWPAVNSHSQSVVHSSHKVIAPADYELRYREYNYPTAAAVTEKEGFREYFWEIKNYKAIEPESYMPEYRFIIPWVQFAPSKFLLSGYSGDGDSWKSFGEFFWNLNKGRDELPTKVESELKALTANATNDREKLKIAYEYLQKTTRYVSIQLGIGGLQPFHASYVYEKGYGDCKALSNYMHAMLKSLGIYSIYTLVQAGKDEPDIRHEFPSDQFNHVILCVPNKGDTLWLECTSQTSPFGYLSRFTMDRHVLLITENGGIIVKTPSFDADKNLQIRNATLKLFEDGSASSVVKTTYHGYQYENISGALERGEEEQRKFLYENISIPSFEIASFKLSQEKDAFPRAFEELNIDMRRYATPSGKRIFFQPNLMNQAKKLDKPIKERKFEVELSFPYTDIDTVEFLIPEGYHLEFLPAAFEFDSDFGAYSSSVFQEEGRVIYIRKRIAYKRKYSPEKYLEFVEYVNKISDADRMKLVLVKET